MCEAQRHRGPDAGGTYSEPGVALGSRRLAIIDVAHGEQPMFNEDGSVVIEWKDKKVAEGKVAGTLRATPQEGMQVGQDFGSAVAKYAVPFRFDGEIRRVVLTLTD